MPSRAGDGPSPVALAGGHVHALSAGIQDLVLFFIVTYALGDERLRGLVFLLLDHRRALNRVSARARRAGWRHRRDGRSLRRLLEYIRGIAQPDSAWCRTAGDRSAPLLGNMRQLVREGVHPAGCLRRELARLENDIVADCVGLRVDGPG